MAQVPYNPVPTVDPQARGAPNVNVATSGEAFGTSIGGALQGLGSSLKSVGDELYARAVALKKLQNETEAREADSLYMIEAGQLHAQFNALEGKDAVAAYPKYQKDLDEARQRIKGSLGNLEAQRMFDSSSRQTMSRSIFNGAGHTATQQKKWTSGTIAAQNDLYKNGVYNAPDDDVAFERTRKSVEDGVEQQGALHGWDPVQVEAAKRGEVSDLIARRISGLAKTDPWKAEEMLRANKDRMRQPDFEKVETLVRSKSLTIGARIIAGEVTADLRDSDDPEGEGKKPLMERLAEGRALAQKRFPDVPLMEDAVENAIRAKYGKHRQDLKAANDVHRLTVEGAVFGMLPGQNGKIPTTVEEITADPKAADAWDRLTPRQQNAYRTVLAKNARGDVIETPERRDRYHTLLGMASSEPAAFLDVNVSGQDIPAKWRTELFKKQLQIKKGQEGDPRTGEAMRLLEPILRPLDINMQGETNKQRYFQFKGALGLALEDWRTQYGKSPNPKEVREIGARLLQKAKEPGSIWGNLWPNETQTFELRLPDKVKEEVVADFATRGMTPPSDEEIRQAYVHKLYKQLQETTKGKKPAEFPTIPMSK